MGFIGAIKSGFRHRTNFTGRSPRSEWWNYGLFVILFAIAIVLAFLLAPMSATEANIRNGSIVVCFLVVMVGLPGIALTARRLHDLDRSGWWSLVLIFPILGQLVFIVWMFMRGTRGTNRFGADPLESASVAALQGRE